jgi:hypothetical protein
MERIRAAAFLGEVGEGGAGVAFSVVTVEVELGEGGVVVLDRGVRGLKREEAHRVDEATLRYPSGGGERLWKRRKLERQVRSYISEPL